MFSLGQGDPQDAVPALGRDPLGIDVGRQFQGPGELSETEFATVDDLPRLFEQGLPLAADGEGVAQHREVGVFGIDAGDQRLHIDMSLIFAEVYQRKK